MIRWYAIELNETPYCELPSDIEFKRIVIATPDIPYHWCSPLRQTMIFDIGESWIHPFDGSPEAEDLEDDLKRSCEPTEMYSYANFWKCSETPAVNPTLGRVIELLGQTLTSSMTTLKAWELYHGE